MWQHLRRGIPRDWVHQGFQGGVTAYYGTNGCVIADAARLTLASTSGIDLWLTVGTLFGADQGATLNRSFFESRYIWPSGSPVPSRLVSRFEALAESLPAGLGSR